MLLHLMERENFEIPLAIHHTNGQYSENRKIRIFKTQKYIKEVLKQKVINQKNLLDCFLLECLETEVRTLVKKVSINGQTHHLTNFLQ